MKIALLDDEVQETEHLAELIRKYAFDHNYDLTCDAFNDGNVLLEQGRYDLYFLDFCMDAMNGIEVAQALKEKFSHAVTICYLTNYDAAAAQIINRGIHADGFLKKPVDEVQLGQKLDQFYRLSFFKRFELKRGKRYQTYFAQDILYVEANNKQIILHLFDRTDAFPYMMREIEQLLPPGLFYRVQRSYLVNLQYVDSYDNKTVTLKSGETLPLKAKDFQKAYHQFMFLFNR